MRVTIEQLHELHEQIRTGRVDGDILQRFIENPLRFANDLGRFGRKYGLVVNYDHDVDRLVHDNRFTGYVNGDVNTVHFPEERRGIREVTVEYYEFEETVTGREAARRIEEDGYVNEDVHALLTFGKEHPIEQLRRPIAALGSRWRDGGNVYAPFLVDVGGVKCGLRLCSLDDEFTPYYRFLVSRKSA